MAPNTVSESILQPQEDKTKSTEIKEILYDGYYYDVTSWIKKHPGGSIIEFYTSNGEDATHAVQQFHQRSSKRIQNMLKSFKKRPATESDFIQDPEKLKRHKALTEDFNKLYLELEKEGMFKPSYTHNIYRLAELIAIGLLGYHLLFYNSYIVKFIGVFLLGLAQGRVGWMQHEGGHHSITGIPNVDRYFQAVIFGIGLGLSGTWWDRGHNRHHAMPQRLKHDVDLDTLPLMAYNAKVVKNKKQGQTFMVQNQMYLFLAIDTLIGTLSWQLYINPKFVLRYRHYTSMFSMLGHYVLAYQIGFWPWLLSTWIMSMYLFGNFSLSHTHLPVTSEPTHWVEYSLVHTADVSGGWIVDWWMGYLNYQIEHHLFPTMPQFRHPQIQPRVKELAKKHNLPFIEYSYPGAVTKTFQNLRDVAKELKAGA